MTNIEPFGSLVLIEKVEQKERKTSSGLVLTTSVLDSELSRGKVIAVGPGDFDNVGNRHEVPLTYGDIVIYSEGQANEVTDALGSKYFFINWRNLLGKEGTF
ncbi:MAG: co-chaperone GroES family protein [Candidatus Omnitrophota bacterium]